MVRFASIASAALLAAACEVEIAPFPSAADAATSSVDSGAWRDDASSTPSDAGPAGRDASTAGLDAAAAGGDAAAAGSDAAAPGQDAAAPGPDAALAGPDAATVVPDAGSCSGLALAQRVRVTTIDVSPESVGGGGYQAEMVLSPLAGGGSKVAWNSGDEVRVTRLDANDQKIGAEVAFAGSDLVGFVARPVGGALLLVQGEAMSLVGFDDSGAQTFKTTFTNNNGKTQNGATWIDWWSHAGRLAGSDTQYASYFGHTKYFDPATNKHQGDMLVFNDLAGASAGYGWAWGCSHSLDVRIAWNGTRFGPVCLSDCYPTKAIWFNHNGALISDEPSGNCSGGSSAKLGGLAAMADGFYVTFTSPEGRASSDVAFSKVANGGAAGPKVYLTSTDAIQEHGAKLAAYGANLLAAWISGSDYLAAVVSPAGAILEGPVALPGVSFNDSDDFIAFSNGDVGWAWGSGNTLKIARLRLCP